MWKAFKKSNKTTLLAVGDGTILDLSEVNDDAFASKSMGDGYAIELIGDSIYAPCDGEVVACFPGGHALGIQYKEFEVMVHIGIDTVELEGEGFQLYVKAQDQVRAGQLLVKLDANTIRDKGYDVTTMVMLTSGQSVEITKLHKKVQAKEEVALC